MHRRLRDRPSRRAFGEQVLRKPIDGPGCRLVGARQPLRSGPGPEDPEQVVLVELDGFRGFPSGADVGEVVPKEILHDASGLYH